MEKSSKKLGEILREMGEVGEKEIQEALELQKKEKILFGEALVKLGYVEEEKILWALAKQYNLSYVPIHLEDLDPELVKKIPREFALKQKVLPLYRIGDEVAMVTSMPQNIPKIEKLKEFLKDFSGVHFQFSLAHPREIEQALQAIYNRLEEKKEPAPWESQDVRIDPTGTSFLLEILDRSYHLGDYTLRIVFHPLEGSIWGENEQGTHPLGKVDPDWQSVLLKKLSLSYPYLTVEKDDTKRIYQIFWTSGTVFERFVQLHLVEPYPYPLGNRFTPEGLPQRIWLFVGEKQTNERVINGYLKSYSQQNMEIFGYSPQGVLKIPEVIWLEEPSPLFHSHPDLIYLELSEKTSPLIVPLIQRGTPLILGSFTPTFRQLVRQLSLPCWASFVEYVWEVARFPLICQNCKTEWKGKRPEVLFSLPERLYTAKGCDSCRKRGISHYEYSLFSLAPSKFIPLWEGKEEYFTLSPLSQHFHHLLQKGKIPFFTIKMFI